MKLAILAAFLFVVTVAALPVEQPEGEAVAEEASPSEGADDLKTEETFWSGYGGYGGRHYGGWGGGYYVPRYYSHGYGGYGGYGWGNRVWHYPVHYSYY